MQSKLKEALIALKFGRWSINIVIRPIFCAYDNILKMWSRTSCIAFNAPEVLMFFAKCYQSVIWIAEGTKAIPCWDIFWDHRWSWWSHRWLCPWPRGSHCCPMTLFLPGRRWFKTGQWWNYNSRNSSAGPFRVVSSVFKAYKGCKILSPANRNHSRPKIPENIKSLKLAVFSMAKTAEKIISRRSWKQQRSHLLKSIIYIRPV